MATKQFLDLNGLSQYHNLITKYIGTEDAKSIKSIRINGNEVYFYKNETASGKADWTITIPDTSDLMEKISNTEGDKVLISDSNGNAVEWIETGYVMLQNTGYSVSKGDLLTVDEEGMIIPSGQTTETILTRLQAQGNRVVISDSNGSISESSLNIDDVATTTALANKIDKISANGGKIATTTATGGVAESNTSISDLTTAIGGKVTKIAKATGGKIATTTASGEVAESGTAIADLAQIGASGFTTGYIVTADSNGKLQATTDPSDFINYIGGVTGGKIVTSTKDGQVAESNTAISDLATQTDLADKMDKIDSASGGKVVLSNANGEVVESQYGIVGVGGETTGFLTGYITDTNIDGILCWDATAGEIQSSDITLDDIATLEYVGEIPQGSSATDVIGYIDEVAGDVGDEMKVTLVEAKTPTTGYLKTYELYQGGNAAANLVGKIDIPKDLVVTSGEIVVNPTGQPAGTYLKLTIANQTAPVYINVADLCDVYTAASGATQVQLAISATNEISATLVAGGVGTTELAANAVTTAKIANDAVTADKVAISAHTEAQTAGAGNGGLNLSITTTDGQVSAVSGSIAANTYDAYGAASTVQSTVIGTAGDAASANTINGAKAYADAATAAIATADIQALFA